MDNQALNEAIEILINNVARNPRLNSLDSSSHTVFDLLQEFWQMKLNGTLTTANTALMFNELENAAACNSNHASAAHLFFNSTLKSLNKASSNNSTTTNSLILYEFLEKPDPPFVCFVTLPNGSCFASFQVELNTLSQ